MNTVDEKADIVGTGAIDRIGPIAAIARRAHMPHLQETAVLEKAQLDGSVRRAVRLPLFARPVRKELIDGERDILVHRQPGTQRGVLARRARLTYHVHPDPGGYR